MKTTLKCALLVLMLTCIQSGLFAKNIGVIYIKDKMTPFKKAVTDSLRQMYSGHQISVIKNYKDKNFRSESFDAVIVMDQLEAWTMFNRQLKSMTKKLNNKKTVYLITAGDPDWAWKKDGVIAVTSASRDDKLSGVIKRMKRELDQILK